VIKTRYNISLYSGKVDDLQIKMKNIILIFNKTDLKKKTLLVIVCLFALLLSQTEVQAQTKKLIHYWHFNNTSSGAHLGAIPADYSTLGNSSLIYKPVPGGGSDTTQAFIDNLAGDTINQRPGYAGCCGASNYGVRTRNPSDNMQFLWYIPTTKYQNIVIKYETQSSSTASGQHRQIFSYSLDSALTFTTAGLPMTYDSAGLAWGKVILDLSSISTVNNTGKFVLKMRFTPPNTGTSGNNRFDNITVEGDTIIKPVIISTALTTGIVNRPYTYTIITSGNPVPVFSVSGNPAWLILNNNTLSGTPPTIGTFGPITISAANIAGNTQQVFSLVIKDTINPITPSINSIAKTTGKIDSLYTYLISTSGVPKPALSVSGNPSWLTLNDSILSGRPLSSGVFGPITITATNISGSAQQSFSITVPSPPQITSSASTTGIVNSLYIYNIAVTGTPAPVLSITGNPSWLHLNGNLLSGTPSSAGTIGPITITATNSEGSSQQIFSISVSSVPAITSTPPKTATPGSLYSYVLVATGTPAPSFSISGNPTWLTLNGNTLSGIPNSSGLIGPVIITATNIASSAQQTFYINVANPAVNTSSSKLIHYWHFNNTLPADGSGDIHFGPHPIMADYSTIGKAALIYKKLQVVVSDTGYIDNLTGDVLNQRSGYGGCCGLVNNAVRTRNPSDSMQFLWYLPTTKYKNIVLKYDTQLSSINSGQREQVFSYSLDSASTFITSGLPVLSNFADTVWGIVTLDLRSITSVNDNRKFVFRICFSSQNTGNKGNNRFDNITLEGDSVSIANSIQEIRQNDYTLYPNPADDCIRLIALSEGERIISIVNSTGSIVSSYRMNGKEMIIDTSRLSSGFYFIKIIEQDTRKGSILKFIKE